MENREIVEKCQPLERSSSVYYYQINLPKIKTKKTTRIICLHDINSHHEFFDHLIKNLIELENDFSFLSVDFLGHGLSSGTRGQLGEFNDIITHLDIILNKEMHIDDDIIVIGDGVGASLILGYLQKQERVLKQSLRGCIIINPKFTYGFDLPHWAKFLYKKFPNNVKNIRLPLHEFNQFLLGIDEQTHLPASDPLILKSIPLKVLVELERFNAYLKASHYFLDRPIFFLLSRRDNKKNLQRAELFFKGIPAHNKRLNHYLSTNLFNVNIAQKISKDIYQWLQTL